MAVCPTCQNQAEREPETNELVCTHCGVTLDDSRIVSDVTFAETSSGKAVVTGQYVANDQAGVVGNSVYGQQAGESRRQTMEKARGRMERIGRRINIPDHIIEGGVRFFRLALTSNFVKGRRSQHVLCACLYLSCRLGNTDHMLMDFAEILKMNVFNIGATYLQLVRHQHIEKLPVIDPAVYIQRFVAQLNFGIDGSRRVVNDARLLTQRMGKDWLQQGRRPAGVAAACILLAARMNNFRRSKAEIVQVAKIAEETLQRRLNEFKNTPAGTLTVSDFRDTNVDSAADPPSFTRHRELEKLYAEKRAREEERELLGLDTKDIYLDKELEYLARELDQDDGETIALSNDVEAVLKIPELQSAYEELDKYEKEKREEEKARKEKEAKEKAEASKNAKAVKGTQDGEDQKEDTNADAEQKKDDDVDAGQKKDDGVDAGQKKDDDVDTYQKKDDNVDASSNGLDDDPDIADPDIVPPVIERIPDEEEDRQVATFMYRQSSVNQDTAVAASALIHLKNDPSAPGEVENGAAKDEPSENEPEGTQTVSKDDHKGEETADKNSQGSINEEEEAASTAVDEDDDKPMVLKEQSVVPDEAEVIQEQDNETSEHKEGDKSQAEGNDEGIFVDASPKEATPDAVVKVAESQEPAGEMTPPAATPRPIKTGIGRTERFLIEFRKKRAARLALEAQLKREDSQRQRQAEQQASQEDENLSDVDDDEIESVLLTEQEIEIKTRVWMSINREYLIDQERKRLRAEHDKANGIAKPQRKRRKTDKKPGTPGGASAADSASNMVREKAPSRKINYAALNSLFKKPSEKPAA